MSGILENYISPTTLSSVMGFGIGIVSTLGAQHLHRKYRSTNESADQKIREIFHQLQISEWSLPGWSFQLKSKSGPHSPKPILSSKVLETVEPIKAMVAKTVSSVEPSTLPNLVIKGVPGVGKTMLVEDLCLQNKVGFIRLPSGAMEKYLSIGDHIANLQKLFEIIQESGKNVYLIMDDGEELVAQRPPVAAKTDSSDADQPFWVNTQAKMSDTLARRRVTLVNAILEEAGKPVRKAAFAVTTNRPEIIDKAFLTRSHVIEIDLPKEKERKNIIITHLPTQFPETRILDFFTQRVLDYMAKAMEGFTGRNIVRMLENLAILVKMNQDIINDDLVEAAICNTRPVSEPVQPKPQPQTMVQAEPVRSNLVEAVANVNYTHAPAPANAGQASAEKEEGFLKHAFAAISLKCSRIFKEVCVCF